MMETLDDLKLQAAIDRGEIIGGALDPRTGRIVPVTVAEVFRNDEDGYTLYEYRNPEGEALAMLAKVDAGGQTRCWRLTEEARKAGYAETEVLYDGSGSLLHWGTDGMRTEYPAPDDAGGLQNHVSVSPGDAFQLVASRQAGARLLSFCTRPFKESYEEVIAVPGS